MGKKVCIKSSQATEFAFQISISYFSQTWLHAFELEGNPVPSASYWPLCTLVFVAQCCHFNEVTWCFVLERSEAFNVRVPSAVSVVWMAIVGSVLAVYWKSKPPATESGSLALDIPSLLQKFIAKLVDWWNWRPKVSFFFFEDESSKDSISLCEGSYIL